MPLYLQHGYGKSDKIEGALDARTVQGVILAPRNEKPEKLEAFSQSLLDRGDCSVLIDPQFYVSAFSPAKVGYLEEYPFFSGGLAAADFSLKNIRKFVSASIDFQVNLGVSSVISPTVLFDSFSDRWYQIAINMADASLEYYESLSIDTPLLLSFSLAEEALAPEDEVNRFLDTVTQDGWTMAGFYLLVARREESYNQDWDATRLANLLYLTHVLGHINGLEVVLGYTDFIGIALRAAGASAFATGWTQGLRQFARKNFLERPPGGQPPRERYSSGLLLNSVFMQELQEIFEVKHLDSVLSGVALDSLITGAPSPSGATGWNLGVSQQHHWQTLHQLESAITGKVRQDVLNVLKQVRAAAALYAILEGAGVEFGRFTGKSHLQNWSRGLTAFARRAGLASS